MGRPCFAYVKPWFLTESNNPLTKKQPKLPKAPPVDPVSFTSAVTFPDSWATELLSAGPGDCVVSDSFRIPTTNAGEEEDQKGPEFCVKLYPKGESLGPNCSGGACMSLQYLAAPEEE